MATPAELSLAPSSPTDHSSRWWRTAARPTTMSTTNKPTYFSNARLLSTPLTTISPTCTTSTCAINPPLRGSAPLSHCDARDRIMYGRSVVTPEMLSGSALEAKTKGLSSAQQPAYTNKTLTQQSTLKPTPISCIIRIISTHNTVGLSLIHI